MAGNWASINFLALADCGVKVLRRLLSEAARATTAICYKTLHYCKRHTLSSGIPYEPNQIALPKAGIVLSAALNRALRELRTHWISLHDDAGRDLAAPRSLI
jgi:hypothetical protein